MEALLKTPSNANTLHNANIINHNFMMPFRYESLGT